MREGCRADRLLMGGTLRFLYSSRPGGERMTLPATRLYDIKKKSDVVCSRVGNEEEVILSVIKLIV
jgi:hypothetical protein